MAIPQTLEGTWEEMRARDSELAGRRVRVQVLPDPEAQTLEEVVAEAARRTEGEKDEARRRILSAAPAPRELPEGATLAEVVMGKWPGDETDAQVAEALERLS